MFQWAIVLAASLSAASAAQASDDFYAGKTVRLIIGTTTAGDYGAYALLLAQHIGKHIPGKPTVIVQSMQGGAGLVALNHVAKIAPQDGTVLSLPHINIVQDGLLNPKVQFDPAKFQWIGRATSAIQVGVATPQSRVQSLEDARQREVIAGASGVTNPTGLNPRILNALAGTKFRIVTGYKGTGETKIAWERGEVELMTVGWDFILQRYGERSDAGLIRPLYVYGKRPPELPNIPSVADFGRSDAEKAFLQIYSIGTEIGRALAFPPGVPAERVEMWRKAFMQMIHDPEFRQATDKGKMRLEPLDGAALAASVGAVVSLPKDTIVQARGFYERLLAEVR
jgi:tripartite-type tricarboxylate transporter receptor subunit TctC